MKSKIFRLTEEDITCFELIKTHQGLPDDTKALRFALSIACKQTAPNLKERKSVYTKPIKVRKYTDEQVSMYCGKTQLSKGWCPKCSTKLLPVLFRECACLRSEQGVEELRSWLINQYE